MVANCTGIHMYISRINALFRTQKRYIETARVLSYQDPNLIVIQDAVGPESEVEITSYLELLLSRKRYEGNHWDDVIQQYKEIDLSNYKVPDHVGRTLRQVETKIESAIGRDIRFLSSHVIDLSDEGFIGPHIDSTKFSGGIVAGLSMLSTRILALTRNYNEEAYSIPANAPYIDEVVQLPVPTSASMPVAPQDSLSITAGTILTNIHPRYKDGFVFNSVCQIEENLASEYAGNGISNCSSSSVFSRGTPQLPILPEKVYIILPPRSLYILRGTWRYQYDHAILGAAQLATLDLSSLQISAPQQMVDGSDSNMSIEGGHTLTDTSVKRRTSIIFRDVK